MKIKQHYKYDCGAACLAHICHFYGAYYTLAELSLYCGCNKDGISIKGIIDGAEKVGLEAKGYNSPNKEIRALKEIGSPFIIHTKNKDGYYHFVVGCNITECSIKIMDPSEGTYKRLSYKDFREIWTGYIIIATPTVNFVKREKQYSTSQRIYALFKLYKRECLLSFAGALACILVGTSTSIFLQSFIDKAIEGNTPMYIRSISILIIALSALSLYIGYCATIYIIRCSIKIDTRLVTDFLNKLHILPISFFNTHPAGDITARMDDIIKVRNFVTTGVINTLTAILTLLGATTFMFAFNCKLAFAVICFIPLYAGLYYLSGRINKRLGKELAVCNSELESGIIENILGITTIKHYNCYSIALNRLGACYVKYANSFYKSANAINKFENGASSIGVSIVAVLLAMGTSSIINKELTIGEFVGFYTLCSFFTAPLGRLMGLGEVFANAIVAFERLQEILDLNDEQTGSNNFDKLPFNSANSDIEFCNAGFSYPGREHLFSNLNFVVKSGEITAIAGKNGSGKSTIASLIAGDMAPTAGRVIVGGMDISLIPIDLWRGEIAYIEQSTHLFSTTILENITCTEGKEVENIEKVLEICSKVGLLELLGTLPMGLLTIVGNNGKILSGGECQKISIARALYKDAQIYIFDEPTAHLDVESAAGIIKIIKELKEKNKHVILISHKESDLELANKIIRI